MKACPVLVCLYVAVSCNSDRLLSAHGLRLQSEDSRALRSAAAIAPCQEPSQLATANWQLYTLPDVSAQVLAPAGWARRDHTTGANSLEVIAGDSMGLSVIATDASAAHLGLGVTSGWHPVGPDLWCARQIAGQPAPWRFQTIASDQVPETTLAISISMRLPAHRAIGILAVGRAHAREQLVRILDSFQPARP